MLPGDNNKSLERRATVDQDFVLRALLQHNFLPNHKRDRDELPPTITSTSFSESAAKKLADCQEGRGSGYPGYDAVEYKLTRFNGVARICSIPHPKAYAGLALCITENWEHLKYVSENRISRTVPERHRDGRIAIMDYETQFSKEQHMVASSFGQRFIVKTDIANFYPSIYSHSIPWAVVGLDEAKKNRGNRTRWYNRLDRVLRLTNRDETNGIAIGPATSDIIAEAILGRVDERLAEDFTYYRYIDDYIAYCDTQEKAERFILELAEELSKYKLVLNIEKTSITPLPQTSSPDWVVDLRNSLPKGSEIDAYDAANYLAKMARLSNQRPDGGVLKYGLTSLVRVMLAHSSDDDDYDDDAIRVVLRGALNFSFHQATLIPVLRRLFDKAFSIDGRFQYGSELQRIMCEHGRLNLSDATSWGLYYSKKYDVPIKECCSNQIMKSQDCIPMLLLYLTGGQENQDKVIGFANSLVKDDRYVLDQYWLLLYQLFLDQKIADPYGDGTAKETSFTIMQSEGVNFVEPITAP